MLARRKIDETLGGSSLADAEANVPNGLSAEALF